VTVPADSTVLVFRYADRGPADARRRAAALADAYITYRVGQSSLLSPATTPRSPAGPDYPVNLLAGLAIGLLLGVATAIGRDRLDDRLRGPLDFHELLALPVLATVPVQAGEARAHSHQPVLVSTPESAAAEPYRYVGLKLLKAAGSLRTAMDESAGPVVVSVTSAVGDDGAMPAAANLAVALAGARARVLLVAGDERSQQLSQVLGVDDGPGLTEVMSGNVSLGAAARPTHVDGLTLLPHGASRSGPGGLVDAMVWRGLLEQLDDVRFVVVLSPPVLAAAESLTWADLADLVVLVATVGESTRRELRAAVSELRGTRGQLVGGVVYEGPVPRTAGSVAGIGTEPPADGSDVGPGASPGGSARDHDGGPADSRTPSTSSAAARSGADA
jgi:receptor protein-tyrosine kinase